MFKPYGGYGGGRDSPPYPANGIASATNVIETLEIAEDSASDCDSADEKLAIVDYSMDEEFLSLFNQDHRATGAPPALSRRR